MSRRMTVSEKHKKYSFKNWGSYQKWCLQRVQLKVPVTILSKNRRESHWSKRHTVRSRQAGMLVGCRTSDVNQKQAPEMFPKRLTVAVPDDGRYFLQVA